MFSRKPGHNRNDWQMDIVITMKYTQILPFSASAPRSCTNTLPPDAQQSSVRARNHGLEVNCSWSLFCAKFVFCAKFGFGEHIVMTLLRARRAVKLHISLDRLRNTYVSHSASHFHPALAKMIRLNIIVHEPMSIGMIRIDRRRLH